MNQIYKISFFSIFLLLLASLGWNYHLLYRLKEVDGFPPRLKIEGGVRQMEPEAKCDLIPQSPPEEEDNHRPLPSPLTSMASKMESMFKGKLTGAAKDVIAISQSYGIDPRLLAAIACHESGFGSSKKAMEQNNVTGTLYYDSKSKRWKARNFSSVRECLEYTARNLKHNYIDSGLTTIASIGKKYCPVGAENDPKGLNSNWVGGVTKIYSKL